MTRWAQQQWAPSQIRLEGSGIRCQVISLVASATDPTLFSQVELNGGMHSLSYLLEAPVEFKDAPELFCLDLYKDFYVDLLAALAKPAEVIQNGFLKLPATGK